MLTLEKLRQYGANTEEGLARCMGNESFYLRLVNMALEDGGFERLRAAAEKGDAKEGFDAAHALKGMLGNLALTPLSVPASDLTEMLRGKTEAVFQDQWEQISAEREKLIALRDEA